MSLVFDIVVLLIIVLFIIIDFKRGFVMVLFSTLSIFVAMAIACIVSAPVSQAVYDNFVKASVQNQVASVVSAYGDKTDEAIDTLLGDGKGSLGVITRICGLDAETAKKQIGTQKISSDVTDYFCENVIRQPMVDFLKVLCTILIFFVLKILLRLIGKPIGRLFQNLKVIGGINRFLGGVLGIVHGVLIALIVLGIIYVLLAFTGGIGGVTTDVIGQSTTVSIISGIVPV